MNAVGAVTRLQLVEQARTWLGTPWVHQGRAKGVAIDCAGLIIEVSHELNLTDFNIAGYSNTPSGDLLRRTCDRLMKRIPLEELQVGCVTLMRWTREPQHLAIVGNYVGGGLSLIHAWAAIGKVAEHRLDNVWMRRICQCYTIPGVV